MNMHAEKQKLSGTLETVASMPLATTKNVFMLVAMIAVRMRNA